MVQDKQELIDRLARRALKRNRDGSYERHSESTYLLMMAEVCNPEVWAKIVSRAAVDAMDGNVAARNWLSKYLMGDTPTLLQAVQIENVNAIGIDIADDKEAAFFTLAKLLNQIEDSLPEGRRSEFNQMVLKLSKLIGSSKNNEDALISIAGKVGAPTDNAQFALYDAYEQTDEDGNIEQVG